MYLLTGLYVCGLLVSPIIQLQASWAGWRLLAHDCSSSTRNSVWCAALSKSLSKTILTGCMIAASKNS